MFATYDIESLLKQNQRKLTQEFNPLGGAEACLKAVVMGVGCVSVVVAGVIMWGVVGNLEESNVHQRRYEDSIVHESAVPLPTKASPVFEDEYVIRDEKIPRAIDCHTEAC